MRVRISADTNQRYFIVCVISANFHCLELFIAIRPLRGGIEAAVTNKTVKNWVRQERLHLLQDE